MKLILPVNSAKIAPLLSCSCLGELLMLLLMKALMSLFLEQTLTNYFFCKVPAQRDKCHIFKCSHFEHFSPSSPPLRDIVSVVILAGKCILGEGAERQGTTTTFVSWFCKWDQIWSLLERSVPVWRFSKWERERGREQKREIPPLHNAFLSCVLWMIFPSPPPAKNCFNTISQGCNIQMR